MTETGTGFSAYPIPSTFSLNFEVMPADAESAQGAMDDRHGCDSRIEGRTKKMRTGTAQVRVWQAARTPPIPPPRPQSGPTGPSRSGRATLSAAKPKTLSHVSDSAQDLQFLAMSPTIRNRNRPAKQVGSQRWLNQHSLNRGSTRKIGSVCRVRQSGMPNEPRRAPPS
jgi:hypothetical protein